MGVHKVKRAVGCRFYQARNFCESGNMNLNTEKAVLGWLFYCGKDVYYQPISIPQNTHVIIYSQTMNENESNNSGKCPVPHGESASVGKCPVMHGGNTAAGTDNM